MIDIYIDETQAFNGYWLYRLFVDGEKYTSFTAKPRLTHSEENDIVALYTEALEYWRG